jgi:hypothetical protein
VLLKEKRYLKVTHSPCALFECSLKHSLTKLMHVLCKTCVLINIQKRNACFKCFQGSLNGKSEKSSYLEA